MHVEHNHAGYEFCYSLDGNWKLTFPHCLFPVKASYFAWVTNAQHAYNYNVCTEQIKPKSAFCVYHTEIEVILQGRFVG